MPSVAGQGRDEFYYSRKDMKHIHAARQYYSTFSQHVRYSACPDVHYSTFKQKNTSIQAIQKIAPCYAHV